MRASYTFLCWLGFVVILLHNVEEALTAPRWLAAHADELRARFGIARMAAANTTMFYTNLVVITLIVLVWIAVASRARPRSFGVYSVALLFCFFCCNAVAPHLIGALLLGGYVPGVVTAVLLVIPFTVWWSITAIRDEWVAGWPFLATAVIAVAVYVPALGFLLGA